MQGVTRRRGFGVVELLVVLGLACVAVLLVAPAFARACVRACRTKCSGNLRQLGMAAIQYADDQRGYPHVGAASALDGGYDTDATPRAVRLLVRLDYHDNPEGFVCADSADAYRRVAPDVREDTRRWSFEGRVADVADPPLAGGPPLPTLRETDELSYGWTRRRLAATTPSTTVLAADRAIACDEAALDERRPGERGNHALGLNVLHADGAVDWVAWGDFVEEPRHAELNVLRDLRWPLAETPPDRPGQGGCRAVARAPGWAWPAALGAPALGLGLLALLVWRRRARGGAAAPARAFVVLAAPRALVRLRCPYCHDALGELGVVGCRACGTALHGACAVDGCTTLGCANAAWRPRPGVAPTRSPRP